MSNDDATNKLIELYRSGRISLQAMGAAIGNPKLTRFIVNHEAFWETIEPTGILRLILYTAGKKVPS